MTAPEHGVNVPLLRKVLEYVTEHPEEYDQREYGVQYPCRTTYCIAGHAVVMSGQDILFDDHEPLFGSDSRCGAATTQGWSVTWVAREALGLDRQGARSLFRESNTLDDVWRIAGQLTNGEIQRPAGMS